jgi:hypothetical protein
MGSLILTTCSDGSSHMQNNMGNVGISSGYNGTGTSWTGITTRSGNVSNITINNSDGSQQGYSVYRTGRNRGAIKDHNSNSWSTYKVTDPGADSSDDGLDVD